MKIICGKKNIENHMINQIVNLFVSNYEEYHYRELCNSEGLVRLLEDESFNCVLLQEEGKICGFAGFYIKRSGEEYKEVMLAHLLIDDNFRGKGYGSLIENNRLKMIQEIDGKKVICASCVEKPYNSIKMKQNRGFVVGGFRYRYRPSKERRENAVLMYLYENIKCNIEIGLPSKITQKILRRGNPYIYFINNLIKKSKYVLIKETHNLGRRIYYLEESIKEGIILEEIDFLQIKVKGEYIKICVRPSIRGFEVIDKMLISNDFYPIGYIPYIIDGYGLLEYQYLPEGLNTILKDNSISIYGREFVEYLNM